MVGCGWSGPSTSLQQHLKNKHKSQEIPRSEKGWTKCGMCSGFYSRTARGNMRRHKVLNAEGEFVVCGAAPAGGLTPRAASLVARDGAQFSPDVGSADDEEEEGGEAAALSQEDRRSSLKDPLDVPLAARLINGAPTLRHLHKANWGNFVATNRTCWADAAAKSGNGEKEEVSDLLIAFAQVPQLAIRRPEGKGGRKRIRKLNEQMLNVEPGEVPVFTNPISRPKASRSKSPVEVSEEQATDPFLKACRAAKATLAGGQYLKGNNKGRISRANAFLKRARNPHHELTSSQLMASLKALHPPAPEGRAVPPLPHDAPLCVVVHSETVRKALQFLASGSAPGPTGWTAELLLAIWSDKVCQQAICTLTKHVINGNLTDEARSVLLSSILIAVGKKNDGIRPIAMVETLYKVAVRYLLLTHKVEISQQCKDVQMALHAGAAERAVHTLRAGFESGEYEEPILLSDDLPNAYNNLSRALMFERLYSTPALAPFFRLAHMAYGAGADLFVCNEEGLIGSIFSAAGVRQGDPLALLLFVLAMQPSFELAAGPKVTPVAIVDDLEIVGEAKEVFASYDRVVESQTKLGVARESDKRFVLWIHDKEPPTWLQEACDARGLTLHAGGWQPDGLWRGGCAEVLGCLFSMHHEDIAEWVCHKVLDHSDFFEGVTHSELGTQNALTMLRYCGTSRMNYLSRIVAPADFVEGAEAFDDLVLGALESLLRVEFSRDENGAVDPKGSTVRALRRSIRNAGFGFRSLSFISPIAFLSSAAMAASSTHTLLEPQIALALEEHPQSSQPERASVYAHAIMESHHSVLSHPGADAESLPMLPQDVSAFCATFSKGVPKHFQRNITHALEDGKYVALRKESHPSDVARWNSQSGPLAAGWKTTAGFSPETRISDTAYRRIARFALGIFQADASHQRCPLCNAEAGPDHALVCHKERCAVRSIPHNRVEAYLLSLYRNELCYPATKQPSWSDSRDRTDIQVVNPHDNSSKEIDVVTILATAHSYMIKSAQSRGSAARKAEDSKFAHKERLEKHGVGFVPFALESHGCAGKAATTELSWIALQLEINHPDLFEFGRTLQQLKEGLSVALQMGNAEAFRRFSSDVRDHNSQQSRRGCPAPLSGSYSVNGPAFIKDPARSYPALTRARLLVQSSRDGVVSAPLDDEFAEVRAHDPFAPALVPAHVNPSRSLAHEPERVESESDQEFELEESSPGSPIRYDSLLEFTVNQPWPIAAPEIGLPVVGLAHPISLAKAVPATIQPPSNEALNPSIVAGIAESSATSEACPPISVFSEGEPLGSPRARSIAAAAVAHATVDLFGSEDLGPSSVIGLFGDLGDIFHARLHEPRPPEDDGHAAPSAEGTASNVLQEIIAHFFQDDPGTGFNATSLGDIQARNFEEDDPAGGPTVLNRYHAGLWNAIDEKSLPFTPDSLLSWPDFELPPDFSNDPKYF